MKQPLMSRGPGGDRSTIVLTGSEVRELLDLGECIGAVERVLGLPATSGASAPGVLGVHTEGGGFHIKAAAARLGRHYFAAKTNGNFPDNPARSGLPTIQGVIVLCDAVDGRPLAVLDSGEITTLRTAAATAVAARHLARTDAGVVTVVGCGVQGRAQIEALALVRPLTHVFAIDSESRVAARFATEMTRSLGLPVEPGAALADATLQSDVIVTCTPSRRPFLRPEHVAPGAFVAAVGADNPEKQEIDPELFRNATIVVDVLDQCATFGDLHHAIEAGVCDRTDVYAELGEIVGGSMPGRRSSSEIILFDSTGTALQDVAAAAVVYERAVAAGRGHVIQLGA